MLEWRTIVVILLALTVIGCQALKSTQKLRDLRFDHISPIMIDVSHIKVISQYEPPFRSPHVEHIMPLPPEHAARQWAHNRLKAKGTSSLQAVFIIRQAAVIEKQLPMDISLTAYFKTQQSRRYDARIEVSLEIHDEVGNVIGEASVTANRSRTVDEKATQGELDQIWQEMIKALVVDMGNSLEETIRQFLARYITFPIQEE